MEVKELLTRYKWICHLEEIIENNEGDLEDSIVREVIKDWTEEERAELKPTTLGFFND